ncbi:hypothetical protein [Flagellimonas sp.]|uniref:hypothetical protein n=1 Tax=Flagellimonas sp. TaxID=2058762 RepID=UPI003BA8E928
MTLKKGTLFLVRLFTFTPKCKFTFSVGDTLNARNNLNKAQETLPYKHTDIYKEYLNEIYQEDLDRLKKRL